VPLPEKCLMNQVNHIMILILIHTALIHCGVANQEVFPSEGSAHELADPLKLVELLAGRVGNVVVPCLPTALQQSMREVSLVTHAFTRYMSPHPPINMSKMPSGARVESNTFCYSPTAIVCVCVCVCVGGG